MKRVRYYASLTIVSLFLVVLFAGFACSSRVNSGLKSALSILIPQTRLWTASLL